MDEFPVTPKLARSFSPETKLSDFMNGSSPTCQLTPPDGNVANCLPGARTLAPSRRAVSVKLYRFMKV